MTVKELIERLQRVKDQDIEIIIKGTGPDDWVYLNEIERCYQTPCQFNEFEGLIEMSLDDIEDDDEELTNYFIIDGGTF